MNPEAANPLVAADDGGGQGAGDPDPDDETVVPADGKEAKVRPEDFLLEVEIGQGAFGKVTMVIHVPSKKRYAMKAISKKVLRKKKISQREWRLERDVLVKIEPHPYIVELVCAFQTLTHFYLVMTYLPGGELFEFLRSRGAFADDVAAFYAAEVTLALEHLHASGVIHRDLKPENLLMDSQGHVVVTDFGLAKIFESHDDVHRTLCGTDEYMAPEMVARRSYGKAVDVWSLGILIFEMVTGKTPFSAPKGDTKELHRKILTEKVKFPSFLSSSTISVLRGLLERQVPKRLGASKATMFQVGGFDALKGHAFFDHIEWQPLARRESPAPLVKPSLSASSGGGAAPKKPMPQVINKRLDDDVAETATNASDGAQSTVLDFEYLRDGFTHVPEPLSPPPEDLLKHPYLLDSPTSSQCDVSSSCASSVYGSGSGLSLKPKKPRPPRKRKKKGKGDATSSLASSFASSLVVVATSTNPASDDDDKDIEQPRTPGGSSSLHGSLSRGRLDSIPDSPHQPSLDPSRGPLPPAAVAPPLPPAATLPVPARNRRLGPPRR